MIPFWGKFLLSLTIGCYMSLFAQSQSDTIKLAEVIVSASDPERYLPGGKQHKFTTGSVDLQNLSQAIEDQVPVYFIQYGATGQLSSINLRGLGANRSSLLWQGMEINSFTLGQTDFSEIAAGSGDLIKIQYGGVGATVGNGALGGTIEMVNQPVFNKGHTVSFKSNIGSYGYLGNSLNYRFSNEKLSVSTKLFLRGAINDFEYKLADSVYKQQNADFQHYGFTQDLNFVVNPSHQISLSFWYNNHHRSIQPSKYHFSGDDEVQSENTRVAVSWQWNKHQLTGNLKGGYTDDIQDFNQSERTRLYRWFASYEMEWNQSEQLMIRAGSSINLLVPKVDSYQDNSKETRSDLYASGRWEPTKTLSFGVNLRAPMVNGTFKAVSPLISGAYLLIDSESVNLTTDLQAGTSYRLPTLNDIYWNPGGNSDLKAETSKNLEMGIGLGLAKDRWNLTTKLRGYIHKVDNWILWVPGGRGEDTNGNTISYWYPENIREVRARGIEYQQIIEWDIPINGLSSSLDFSGAYNRAENMNALSPVDRSKNKQLPYTPAHIINGSWNWVYHSWTLQINSQYRSERFVETNNELPSLPEYSLWRFALGKHGNWGAFEWGIQFQVNNAFNESYETYENRAMPGRNYQLNLTIATN